jgi:peptide/nickel transport system ATP-binding protein
MLRGDGGGWMPVLDIQDVSKVYKVGGLLAGSSLRAVDQVTLAMAGESPTILSIVGESGSGKTTLARMILRLVEPTTGTIAVDTMATTGHGATKQNPAAFRRLVQPIFQNPFEAFSLRRKVEAYLFDTALRLGVVRTKSEARQVVADALTSVGLDLNYVTGKYPSHFSGGELQRMSIARALICRPKLIVADEPVAMIDASLKMNIVNLFLKLKDEYNINFVYITHDLSTAYYVSDYIAIMYRGSVVEYGPSSDILTAPAHPYTQLLMDSIPMVGVKWADSQDSADTALDESGSSTACKFAGRCPYARDICRTSKPPLVTVGVTRQALCYKPVDYRAGVTEAASLPVEANRPHAASRH